MDIDNLTISEAKEIARQFGTSGHDRTGEHPFTIGKNYFIRTVTHHLTGKLVKVTPQELVLEGAAWIADDGKFSDALKTETFSEVEMFPDRQVIVGRAALIDAVTISKIPTSSK